MSDGALSDVMQLPLSVLITRQVNATCSGERAFDIEMDKNAEFGPLHLVVIASQSMLQLQTRVDLNANGELGTHANSLAE